MRSTSLITLSLCATLLAPQAAWTDVLELASGGRVEGRLVESSGEASVEVELDSGARVTLSRAQIARLKAISEQEAQYREMAHRAPDTVEAHWKLAEWCRDNRLRDEAQRHFERIIELDPNHADARAALGFRKKGDEWVTRDDVLANRGLVLYQGRYITPQHVELLERREEKKETEGDWAGRLKRWRRWLTGRREDRAAEARAEIGAVRDPLAAEAVVELLQREDVPAIKRLWIETAARLKHRAAVEALVELSLQDPSEEVRYFCLELLLRTPRPGLSAPYVRALASNNNEIVNRAAVALRMIGDFDAAGPLIDALVTKHRIKISDVNPDQQAYTFSQSGSAYTFGSKGPQYITQPMQNPEVLSALVALSGGESFQYDQVLWRRWLAAQSKLHVVDLRRDP